MWHKTRSWCWRHFKNDGFGRLFYPFSRVASTYYETPRGNRSRLHVDGRRGNCDMFVVFYFLGVFGMQNV